MKRNKLIYTLAITLALSVVMIMGMTQIASAESDEVTGHCYFNGSDIVCDFDSNVVVETVKGLEPGDDVTFKVKFENRYDETTHWYMRNETLTTLEQSYDRTQNGGYTYKLTHIAPDGEETVLFDNSKVGGVGEDGHSYAIDPKSSQTSHGTDNTGEGLHQATNAADEWFFIQTLGKKQAGYTELYVKFDGETEVNDYMDTAGKLLLAYAVELDKTPPPGDKVKTGDDSNLLLYLAVMTAALLMLMLTILSFMKDRREARAAAGAYGEGTANMPGDDIKQRKERG